MAGKGGASKGGDKRRKNSDGTDRRSRLRSVLDGETVASVDRSARRRRMAEQGAVVGAFVCAVCLAGALFAIAVLPTQTWRNERDALHETTSEIAELEAERDRLDRRVSALATDSGIEAEARNRYGLVDPEEETYIFNSPLPTDAPRQAVIDPDGVSPEASLPGADQDRAPDAAPEGTPTSGASSTAGSEGR